MGFSGLRRADDTGEGMKKGKSRCRGEKLHSLRSKMSTPRIKLGLGSDSDCLVAPFVRQAGIGCMASYRPRKRIRLRKSMKLCLSVWVAFWEERLAGSWHSKARGLGITMGLIFSAWWSRELNDACA